MRNSRLIILSLFVALSFVFLYNTSSVATTTITSWDNVKNTPDYAGTQASTAAVGKAANGIVWSRHNLSSYGWPFQAVTVSFDFITSKIESAAATTEICVFCHTPHFAKTDTAPLWNRSSAAGVSYVAYGTSAGTGQSTGKTLAGTATGVSGSSLACLSCHDGVTTFDNLINSPGKGSRTDGTGADQGWRFYMDTNVAGDITLEHFSAVSGDCSGCHSQGESNRLNIGLGSNFNYSAKIVDLSNDHPINVAYNDGIAIITGTVGRASLRPQDTVISSITMLNARMNYGDSVSHALDGNDPSGYFGRSDNLWAVKGYISDTATINDLLRDGGKVQCTSCHDPHYKNQTNNDPALVDSYDRTGYGVDYNYEVTNQSDPLIDGLFLRRVGGNSNSGLCRTCHNK